MTVTGMSATLPSPALLGFALAIGLMTNGHGGEPIDSIYAEQEILRESSKPYRPEFGRAVAASGDTIVVGAGINGAVHVFVRGETGWREQARLHAYDENGITFGDRFGWSVAISGDTIVVGAVFEDSNARGVDGNPNDNSSTRSGGAYVFVREGTQWSQQAFLKASNSGSTDQFGSAVAVSGDTVAVGALFEDSGSSGVNGDQANNSASTAGAAYVFVRNGTQWSQQAYLKASNPDSSDWFGGSVAVSDDTVVVGAIHEEGNSGGINGDESNNDLRRAGAAYVFVRSGTVWSQQAYLKPAAPNDLDLFGYSVAASGNTVAVGSYFEGEVGAAYVFARSGIEWHQQAHLQASNADPNDRFGYSVAVAGDRLVVGADLEDSDATSINGDQLSNAADGAGAAYVFERSGTLWSQRAYLKASNAEGDDSSKFRGDRLGAAVAATGDYLAIGAPLEGGPNNTTLGAGAVYVFGTQPSEEEPIAISSVSLTPTGLLLTASPPPDGYVLSAEYSPDLSADSWVEIGTFVELGGLWTFAEDDFERGSRRSGFYRGVLRPL